MHQDISVYLKCLGKLIGTSKTMLAKPIGKIMLIPIAAAPMFTTTQRTLCLLAILFVFDFITGIGASWVEFKKALPLVPGSGKRYVLSSSKLRLSGVKFTTYAMGILTAYALEVIFVVKEFQPEHLTTEKLTLTTIVTLFFCSIEFYSIFFENVKRMGFDIIQKIKTMFSTGHDLYKSAKNDTKKE